MTDTVFSTLWAEALTTADRDAFVSDWALSSIWGDDPETDIPQERIDCLGRIWDVAHMSVRDICKAARLSQTALAQRFCIPYRTVQNWCGDVNKCPDYVRLMMAECLGLIQK